MFLRTCQLCGLSVVLSILTIEARAQAPFHQGKTITIIQGRDAGGAGDGYVKSIMPFLQKYIPGNPTIVVQYMPGAGGRKMANFIYRNARADGLNIGAGPGGIIQSAVLGESGVQYELDRLIFLGSTYSSTHPTFVTRKAAGFGSLEKLRAATNIRVGGQAIGHTLYNEGRLFALLLGLQEPKFVVGYSGRELDVALLGGEIDARATLGATLVGRDRQWIEKDLVDFHSVIEVPKGEKHSFFSNLPDLETFAKSEIQRKLLTMVRAFRLVGAPFILPPGTPKERVVILRDAMRKSFLDPEFLQQYKQLVGDEPTPLMPEAQEKAIRDIPRDPPSVEALRKVFSADPLPLR
jgi:tripartite-type tricarboxylate transporter receptor subunit TctC